MTHQTLEVEMRTVLGNSLRKLRHTGLVPAVVYGNGVENFNIQFPVGIFLKTYKLIGKTTVVDLVVKGGKKLPCLVYELDVHPVLGTLRHVDFLAVNLSEKTTATVPVNFVGEPSKEVDGVIIKSINELEVEALPDSIPHHIDVDLSILQAIGDVITVSDLAKNANYEILDDGDLAIVSFNEVQEEKEEPAAIIEPTAEAATLEAPKA
ncbi:MAG: 50S ribosomal protein L25 [bacterium]